MEFTLQNSTKKTIRTRTSRTSTKCLILNSTRKLSSRTHKTVRSSFAKAVGRSSTFSRTIFFLLEFEVKNLFEANEEMLKWDPNDYDLIEARQENLVFINKKLARMKEIQSELTQLCPTNPICKVNVFDFFGKSEEKKVTENVVNVKVKEEESKEVTSNVTQEIDL